ncbi:unnamed protein product, partial [Prorocentrum cordatum]
RASPRDAAAGEASRGRRWRRRLGRCVLRVVHARAAGAGGGAGTGRSARGAGCVVLRQAGREVRGDPAPAGGRGPGVPRGPRAGGADARGARARLCRGRGALPPERGPVRQDGAARRVVEARAAGRVRERTGRAAGQCAITPFRRGGGGHPGRGRAPPVRRARRAGSPLRGGPGGARRQRLAGAGAPRRAAGRHRGGAEGSAPELVPGYRQRPLVLSPSGIVRWLDRLASTAFREEGFSLAWAIDEFEANIALEVDFLREARNATRCRELFASHPRLSDLVVVPRVHPALSSSRLLTI